MSVHDYERGYRAAFLHMGAFLCFIIILAVVSGYFLKDF